MGETEEKRAGVSSGVQRHVEGKSARHERCPPAEAGENTSREGEGVYRTSLGSGVSRISRNLGVVKTTNWGHDG